VGGTFVFAALVNWTINGRSILPMVPAVAILVVRRLDREHPVRPKFTAVYFAAGVVMTLLVTWADCVQAQAVREVAAQTSAKFGRTSEPFWFQGHWGFQYYMQELGALPVDFKSSPVKPGDSVAIPSNNTNLIPPPESKSILLDTLSAEGFGCLSTMDQSTGAGFYSSVWGPLPFAFGHVPPEYVRVYELKQPSVAAPQNPK
jgi:hypothetical protein